MTARPRVRLIVACISAALAQWGSGSAFADSAVGVDTALGNALNLPGRSAMPRPLADDSYDTVRHSPSGQLYGVPLDRSDEDANKTESGWLYSGGIEAGVLGGGANDKNAKFREYKDLKNGAYLNYFEGEGDKPDTANFVQVQGGGTGRHDQFYGMQFGRYNDWKVKLFYNETIHVYTDTWKSLYNGEGAGNQTIKTGAAPTAVTSGTLAAQSAALGLTAFGAAGNCTTAAPCWAYNGKLYSNASALAAITGVAGTYGGAAGTTLLNATQSGQSLAIANTLAATDNSELSIVRKKGGARFDLTLDNFWKGYVSVTQEKRTGSRPTAMNFGSGNQTVDVAEPIDYTTSDFLAGVGYTDTLTEINLRASASIFRNGIDKLTIDNPLLGAATPWGTATRSTFDLAPNSSAFNLKGEFARNLPELYQGRFTAALAWGSNRQNDSLMAPVDAGTGLSVASGAVSAGAGYPVATGATSFNINNWNTAAALSQQTASQRLDSKLLNLGLSLKPIDDLSVKGTARHYETINKSNDGSGHQYTAYNPLTGQYGMIRYNDSLTTVVGSSTGVVGSPCYTPSGVVIAGCTFNGPVAGVQSANNPSGTVVYSLARDYKQDNFGFAADYDLGNRSSVEGSLERENFTRRNREREKTWEDKFKLGYVNRDFDIATLRTSYETGRRRGGDYNSGVLPDVAYYPQLAYAFALPGNSITNVVTQVLAGTTGYTGTALTNYLARYAAQGRKTDLADRDQDVLNARVNFTPRQDLDLGVMLQVKTAKYPEVVYGAEKDNLNSLNFDINYQPSSEQQITAYYSRQDGIKQQNGNSGGGSCTAAGLGNSVANWLANCAMTTSSTTVGAGQYLATNSWNMTTKDINDIIGLAFQQDIGNTRLAVDYTYAQGRTRIGYNYGPNTFSPITNQSAAMVAAESLLGNAMPDMTTVQHTLTANLLVPVDKKLSYRLMYRYEAFKVKDWHYDDVIKQQVLNLDGGSLLLDSGPANFHNNVIGFFVQYKL